MKFIFKGDLTGKPIKDVDLVRAGIFKPTELIHKGTEFEIPDEEKLLIQQIKASGYYEPVDDKKTIKKTKKEDEKVKEEK